MLAVLIVGILTLTVFGGFRLKDPQGNVAFGWDSTRHRFQVMEKPRLMLEGPHVFPVADGYQVIATEQSGEDWRLAKVYLPLNPLPVLTVRVDNPAKTQFEVAVRAVPVTAEAVYEQNPPRLLMVSDMEGQFDKFVSLLRSQHVLDEQLHWRYGDGHVALVGDFVDRGEDMTPLLWRIYRLEEEAVRAGGRVHYVVGNHEQLAMSGRKKYWPRRLIATAQALGEDGDERLFSDKSVLGVWLRSKPVIVKLGDHLLVHGGVSQAFLAENLSIDATNELARKYLDSELIGLPPRLEPVLGRNGLTWYRGMAMPGDKKYALEANPLTHLRSVVARCQVKRVAIAHTIVPDIVLEQQGMLLRLDVHHAEQTPQAAYYENARLWRVDANGERFALN